MEKDFLTSDYKRVIDKLKGVDVKESFPPVGDAHAITAEAVFGEAKDAFYGKVVTDKRTGKVVEGKEAKVYYKEHIRHTAKQVGLAVPYGGTGYAVSGKLGCTKEEGDRVVEGVFSKNPYIRRYVEGKKAQVKREKKVTSLFGRIRYLPAIDSPQYGIRAVNERLACNAPIQMSGAEQLKLILIKLDDFCERGRLNRVSGNLLIDYKDWYTRVVGLVGEDRLKDVEEELDKIEQGNCKVVVFRDEEAFKKERISGVYDRCVRLTWEDIRRLRLVLIW